MVTTVEVVDGVATEEEVGAAAEEEEEEEGTEITTTTTTTDTTPHHKGQMLVVITIRVPLHSCPRLLAFTIGLILNLRVKPNSTSHSGRAGRITERILEKKSFDLIENMTCSESPK